MLDGLLRQNRNPHIFRGAPADYGLKFSESTAWGGASTWRGEEIILLLFERNLHLLGYPC